MPSTFSDAGAAVLLAVEEPADGAAIAGVAINAMEAVAAISLFNTTCYLPLFDSLADQLRAMYRTARLRSSKYMQFGPDPTIDARFQKAER
jgi:hypothetical protein